MNTSPRFQTLARAGGIFLAAAILLLATSSPLPIVWDEGDTMVRGEQIARAFNSTDAGHQSALEEFREPENWPFTLVREGHPPLAGIVIALGTWLAPESFDPLARARFGPILLFALAAAAMFYRLERDYRVPAVSMMALAALFSMPRLFAHAHFATLDGPLSACWVLAWAAFAPACRNWKWAAVFGVALGLTLCAKFTGWLAPIPFMAWTALYRSRGGLIAMSIGLPIALGVFVLLNPPLWSDPVAGLRTFFALNLNRAADPALNISTQFFGRMYNLDFPLPWYNTLVWTAITVSPMTLILGGLGVHSALKFWRADPAGMLVYCQWATLIVVRALPWSPPHDAERLILPSFAFFAALAGIGIGRGLYRKTLTEPDKIIAQGWAKVLMAIALVAGAFDAVSYFPHGLSYYNRLIGGLRGAVRLGMEPTYYWDSLDRTALAWLAEHTRDDEKIAFAAAPPRNLELLKRWGLLDRLPSDPGTFRWYVLQRRPSAWQAADRWLIEHETAAFERAFGGVPLLSVYSYEQFQNAKSATADQ